jgi:hypothetical protein
MQDFGNWPHTSGRKRKMKLPDPNQPAEEKEERPRIEGRLTGRFAHFLYAIIYGVVMMWFGGADFKHLYSPSPYHRLQADAILHGHLYVGNSIGQIGHDLAWHAGQVNQIWGLGVGLWLTPFEFAWRLLGGKWFPDRIPLGIALALLAGYAWSLGRLFATNAKRSTVGIGFVWLIVFCPSIWALNQGGRPVYEETSLYALLVSMGILIAVVRVAHFGLRRDYLICASLAALSALMRPTHGIYGLAGMVVSSAILMKQRRFKIIIFGNAIYVAGLMVLLITNWYRFGSPMEFGHRLTITGEIVVFMTRFGNPMRHATILQAGKELYSWLFLFHQLPVGISGTDQVVPWQAPYARWRDPYMTTFDPGWAIVVAAGFFGTVLWLGRKIFRRRAVDSLSWGPAEAVIIGTFVWASISAGALLAFYLYFPNLSARYIMDLAPGFTGFALLVWFWVSRRWPRIGLMVLSSWLGYGILTVQYRPSPLALLEQAEILTELPRATNKAFDGIHGKYDFLNHPGDSGLFGNGKGWKKEDGEARAIVMLAIDAPEFVEIVVGPGKYSRDDGLHHDAYRAAIDGHLIPVEKVNSEEGRTRVRFTVPEAIRRRAGEELLFLSFTSGYDMVDRESRRILYSVQWH